MGHTSRFRVRRRPAATSAGCDDDFADPTVDRVSPAPSSVPGHVRYGEYRALGRWGRQTKHMSAWLGLIAHDSLPKETPQEPIASCAFSADAHDVSSRRESFSLNEIKALLGNEKHGVISMYGRPYAHVTPEGIVETAEEIGPPRIVVGFDAEWTIDPNDPRRRRVLSYQLAIAVPDRPRTWFVGVYFPVDDCRHGLGRLLGHFLRAADAAGVLSFRLPAFRAMKARGKRGRAGKDAGRSKLASKGRNEPIATVVLAGHFSIMDLTMLYRGHDWLRSFDTLRRTETSVMRPMGLRLVDHRRHGLPVTLYLRDSMLLASEKSSLASLGDAMRLPKVDLPPGFEKAGMDVLLERRPDAFLAYAAVDALITLEWVLMVAQVGDEHLPDRQRGRWLPPPTVGAMSAGLIRRNIIELAGLADADEFDLYWRGVRTVREPVDSARGLRTHKTKEPCDTLAMTESAWSSAFLGGRNEAFAHGPHSPRRSDRWWDWDVKNAYVSAMGLIRDIDWEAPPRSLRTGRLRAEDFGPTDFLVVSARFRFPASTSMPCLPVKDASGHGLIFPLRGQCIATAPELYLALQLGAEIEVIMGYALQVRPGSGSLGEAARFFIRMRARARAQHGKNSPQERFWKDLGNAAFGKTGQGLRAKRSYSTRRDAVQTVPCSPVTCAPVAALITGLVRALVSSAIAELVAQGYSVLSVTTDGFITDADPAAIDRISGFGFVDLFRSARRELPEDDGSIWECKHAARQMVVGRTRAAWGTGRVEELDLPSAKGSYKLKPEDVARINAGEAEAELMARLFADRDEDFHTVFAQLPSPSEYVRRRTDGAPRQRRRKVDWSYDFKRAPDPATISTEEIAGKPYVSFSTIPHETVEAFAVMRGDYDATRPLMRTERDVRDFLMRNEACGIAGRCGVRRATLVDGGMRRTAAIQILRGIRHGRIVPAKPVDGPAIRGALAAAFDVELTADDWKNAARRQPKAVLTAGMTQYLRAAGDALDVTDWCLWARAVDELTYCAARRDSTSSLSSDRHGARAPVAVPPPPTPRAASDPGDPMPVPSPTEQRHPAHRGGRPGVQTAGAAAQRCRHSAGARRARKEINGRRRSEASDS